MQSRQDTVQRAIAFDHPERVPIVFRNRDQPDGDVMLYHLKPGYRRQFARARAMGLHVWYHCCGDFAPIIPDFHEIGVDVLNISQPNTVNLNSVGHRLRGKQCFMMPVSYQTVSISGTPDDILAEAQRMYNLLATNEGGFIGYVEEYGCMGMSDENYWACGEAFRRLRPS